MHETTLVLDRQPPQLQEPASLVEVEGLDAPRPPAWGAVAREQLRAVGESLRREALGLAAIMGVVTATILSQMFDSQQNDIDLVPQALIPIALLGLLAPLAVWKTEGPGRRGYHRSMPVDAMEHAIARSAAGWAWTMAAAGGYVLWLLAMMGISGGEVIGAPMVQWLAPFAGATVLYLTVSGIALVARHPWRWLAGGVVGYSLVNMIASGIPAVRPLEALMEMLWSGRFGLLTVITGMARSFPHWSWDAAPGAWLVATAFWLAASGGVFLAAARHQPDE